MTIEKNDNYIEFLNWLSIKLNIKITHENYISGGVYGEVYDIGRGRVIKITSTNITEQQILLNKNIEGICKVYSVGEIVIPKRFITKTKRSKYEFKLKDVVMSGYIPNKSTYYIIMEKLDDKKALIDLTEFIFNMNYFINDNDNSIKYNYSEYNILKIINNNRNNEEFLSDVISYMEKIFDKDSELQNFYIILSMLLTIFNNVSKYFYWFDIHKGQFGYDKNNNLKAFDIDNEKSTYYMEYHTPKHKIIESIEFFNDYIRYNKI